MLDTYRKLETPENIDLDIRVAGPLVRAQAFLVDSVLRLIIQIATSIGFVVMGDTGIGLLLIFTFALEWFYPVLFEVLNHGQTPGKRLMNIAVVNDDNTPVGWSASITRNFLRIVDFLPMNYVTGLICMTINKDFKRIGDLAAGTVVIYRERLAVAPALESHSATPPPVAFNVAEQRAILAFAERRASLTSERQQEIVNHLEPVLHRRDQQAVDYLLCLVQWLRGGR